MKLRTVELRVRKGWVSQGWQKDYSAFAAFIHNVARVEEVSTCTFFYDGNNNLIGTITNDVLCHDFPVEGKELAHPEPTTICSYCKEPLTSDDFKVDECTTMHERCAILDEEAFHENHPDPMEGFTTNLDNFHGDRS